MTHSSSYNILNSKFSKFSAPLILNTFVSVRNCDFHSALSATLKVNFDDDTQIISSKLDQNFTFYYSRWSNIYSGESVIDIQASDDETYYYTVNFTSCLFISMYNYYPDSEVNIPLFTVSAPTTNIEGCCFANFEGISQILSITHPKTINQDAFPCSHNITTSTIAAAQNIFFTPIVYETASFVINNLNVSYVTSQKPICSFITKDAVVSSRVQTFTTSQIYSSEGSLISFQKASTDHNNFGQVLKSNFVNFVSQDSAIQSNYQCFFFWSYFQNIDLPNNVSFCKYVDQAEDDNTTFIVFVYCSFSFEPNSIYPSNQYDNCFFSTAKFQTTLITFLDTYQPMCQGFSVTYTNPPFEIPGFDDNEFIGAVVSVIALIFVCYYLGYFIIKYIAARKKAKQQNLELENPLNSESQAHLGAHDDNLTNGLIDNQNPSRRGSISPAARRFSVRDPASSRRNSVRDTPARRSTVREAPGPSGRRSTVREAPGPSGRRSTVRETSRKDSTHHHH